MEIKPSPLHRQGEEQSHKAGSALQALAATSTEAPAKDWNGGIAVLMLHH